MSKQFRLFDPETLIVEEEVLTAACRAGQNMYPRTALLKEPLKDKKGYKVTVVLDEEGCAIDSEYTRDYRGKTIYNKSTCTNSKVVDTLGLIEDEWTLLKPKTDSDVWTDGAWVTDKAAKYAADVERVRSNRRSLYSTVDSMNAEAAMMRRMGEDEAEAVLVEGRAHGLYIQIRKDHPWPKAITE